MVVRDDECRRASLTRARSLVRAGGYGATVLGHAEPRIGPDHEGRTGGHRDDGRRIALADNASIDAPVDAAP